MRKTIIFYSILLCIVLSFAIGYNYQAIDEFLNDTNMQNGLLAVCFFSLIASLFRFNFLLRQAKRSRDYYSDENEKTSVKYYKVQDHINTLKAQVKTLKANKKNK